jgi:hypothetical protein
VGVEDKELIQKYGLLCKFRRIMKLCGISGSIGNMNNIS